MFGEEDGVLVLNENNFQLALQTYPLLMVEFYAPWCKHCQKLAPDYAVAAQALKEKGIPARLAKVDSIKNKDLARREGVKGYPLIKWYRGGIDTDFYKHGREKETLVEWVERKSKPSTLDIDNIQEAKTFIDENKIAVIGFFKVKDCDKEKIFKRVGYSFEDVKFAITDSVELFKHFEVTSDSAVILFKKFEESQLKLDKEISFKAVKEFINLYSTPDIIEYSEGEWKTVFHGKYKKHFFLWMKEKSEENQAGIAALRTVAKEFKDDIMFVLIRGKETDHPKLSKFFRINQPDIPTFRMSLTRPENIFKYKPESNDLTEDNFRNFVTHFISASLKPDLKSQDLPADWDKKPVKEVVGSNFKEVALNKARYVFVYFYSPSCESCEELGPVMDQLAEKMKMKGKRNIVIAKMNGAENEIEIFKVRTYPTLKLFKSGDNEVVEFTGKEKTVEEMSEFLETNCKVNVGQSNSLRDKSGKHLKDEL